MTVEVIINVMIGMVDVYRYREVEKGGGVHHGKSPGRLGLWQHNKGMVEGEPDSRGPMSLHKLYKNQVLLRRPSSSWCGPALC